MFIRWLIFSTLFIILSPSIFILLFFVKKKTKKWCFLFLSRKEQENQTRPTSIFIGTHYNSQQCIIFQQHPVAFADNPLKICASRIRHSRPCYW